MKKAILVSLLISSLAACNSTSNTQTVNNLSSPTKSDGYAKPLSDSELQELAKNTKFTSAELKAAANKLGLKCSVSKVTGSRIKKKVCTSTQQRLAHEEARRSFIERQRFDKPAAELPIGH